MICPHILTQLAYPIEFDLSVRWL